MHWDRHLPFRSILIFAEERMIPDIVCDTNKAKANDVYLMLMDLRPGEGVYYRLSKI